MSDLATLKTSQKSRNQWNRPYTQMKADRFGTKFRRKNKQNTVLIRRVQHWTSRRRTTPTGGISRRNRPDLFDRVHRAIEVSGTTSFQSWKKVRLFDGRTNKIPICQS